MKPARRLFLALMAALGVGAACPAGAAEPVADFYSKNPISIFVASGPGGGFDAYARVMAPHLRRHVPGNPNIIIRNMPGATGLVAMNYIYNSGPKDGSAIIASFNTAVLAPLFGDQNAKFDPREMEWLGSIGKQTGACLTWGAAPIKSLADAQRVETLVGATGEGAAPVMFPKLLNAMIGTKFKVITGYSTPGLRLAVENQEIHGICGIAWETHMASVPNWILDKKVTFIAQLGLSKSVNMPGVPMALDLIQNPDDREIYRLLAIQEEFGRPFLTPPKTEPDRLAALQAAFAETLKDPAYQADALRAGQFLDPLSPSEARALVNQAYAAPKAILKRAAEYSGGAAGN
jgi:tripartite-type tricarboxylate transporter receptor subunit TctC